ncbi:hypothetical protein E2C01_000806 [Portunus trituberculatus]|uniref:Uncharacterized protein n=1 Tax=Portunus trituberculatus TaxID=210409 RepID=A0A5B7CG19_PORTR|nr:hypothetical protein [Portunus trituberculatus]
MNLEVYLGSKGSLPGLQYTHDDNAIKKKAASSLQSTIFHCSSIQTRYFLQNFTLLLLQCN